MKSLMKLKWERLYSSPVDVVKSSKYEDGLIEDEERGISYRLKIGGIIVILLNMGFVRR